ncbi:hypothetical protein BGZ80_000884 [Entomortierella chlamydospora]|uniref:Uncharacterized protein n=1 Tax=Entomortierella chlamydospora TaxID=101097 RepID=A0A9P6SYP1_9FUNG|nr:hypothetical protein BGZ80_000884 [Entomortierella chlamydospora]
MGWFSKSTADSSVEPQQDTTTTQPSLAKDGSSDSTLAQEPTVSTPSTPASASTTSTAGAEAYKAQEHTHIQEQRVLPRYSEELMEFEEYKPSDDIFDRYKVSDALNQLAICSSLGANVRNYYRYGTYRSCTDKYDHLKFCFSIKTKSSQVAQVMIQKREAEIRAKKRGLPNSEDVWTVRT